MRSFKLFMISYVHHTSLNTKKKDVFVASQIDQCGEIRDCCLSLFGPVR